MKTNILLTLDTRRIKKNGTYPLIFRLRHFKRAVPIKTGISVLEKDWDGKNRKIKKSFSDVSSVTRLNNQLQKKKSEFLDIIFELNENDELKSISIIKLKEKLLGIEKENDFFSFAENLILDLKKSERFGNARIYQTTINVIRTFNKRDSLEFREINYEFLKKFETYHLAKGNSLNSLSVYIRTLRAIFNQAISLNAVDSKYYPFDGYSIKHTKTIKRAISNEDLKKVINLKLDSSHECFHARNYFIISYMLYGINFIDLAFLKLSNFTNNRMSYKRRKTGKEYDIKVSSSLAVILKCYTKDKKQDDFIFPIIKRESSFEQFRDSKYALASYNKKLKKIAKLCKIETNLTSYVSRHSFATQAMLKDVPLTAISEMMGHARINTTQVYLKTLPNEILDSYNEDIIDL